MRDDRAVSLLVEMEAALSSGGVLTGDDVSLRSEDIYQSKPCRAEAIFRPRSTADVSLILSAAKAKGAVVITHGGRTGLSGGAGSVAGEYVISLERMNQIESVDPVAGIVVAQAGVTIEALQQAAKAEGLYYPVDLGSRGTATVGGTVATNAGGNRTLRWGMTRDRVLGLEAVLADGTVVSSMNKLVKNNTGYDLKHLFIGSEGTLGVVTRAVFRMVPLPVSQDVALVAVPSNAAMLRLLNAAKTLSSLSAFELMYPDFYRSVTEPDVQPRPLPMGAHGYVLIETLGYDPDRDRAQFEACLGRMLEEGVASDAVMAQSDQQCACLWKIRESVDVAVRGLMPLEMFDVSLGVADIDPYLTAMRARLVAAFPDMRMAVQGHVGDNNIHLGITVGPHTHDHSHAIDTIVFEGLQPFAGSVSAEHGIGTHKNDWLSVSRSDQEIALMRTIKRALDPDNRLNPRVLFPRSHQSS